MTTYQQYAYYLKKYCKSFDVDMETPCVGIEAEEGKIYMASFASAFALVNTLEPVRALFVLNRKGQTLPLDVPGLAWFSAEHRALRGSATHYFVETADLAKFCVKATLVLTKEILASVVDGITGRAIVEAVIHTPNDSILFRYFGVDETKKPYITFADGSETGSFFLEGDILERARSERTKYMIKFVFGMCLYLHCFPNAMIDGVPKQANSRLKNHFKREHSVTVRTVPEIIDRSGTTPHFRAGHFRLLSSDKFIKKQGQVIFIKETFVLGKAKTITDQVNEEKCHAR